MSALGVVGWGCVSALGLDVASQLVALRAGRRGQGPVTRSPHLIAVNGQPPFACEAPLDVPLRDRAQAMVRIAVDEALAMAGPSPGVTGVFVGTTGGFFVEADIDLYFERLDNPAASAWFGRRGVGAVAQAVARQTDAAGPVLTYATACTSSSVAMAAAGTHLRAGTCARAIVVGFDLLASMTVYGFRSLLLYDSKPSRPFDSTRAGLQLGEGCGVVILQQGPGRFELLGSANRLDGTSMTGASTDGSSVEQVVRSALQRSGVAPDEVVSIKAHGTGTVDNDLAEGRGIARIWGGQPPPFASLKGALGHTLGGAGAIEAALWLAALADGFLPASVGFVTHDPDIGVSPNTATLAAPKGAHVLNAFGFGGSCVAFVVKDA